MRVYPVVTQFVVYTGVGAVGTLAHYVVLLLLVERWQVVPYQGALAGFLLGALVNYFLNHRITFRSARRHHEALPKFLFVALLGMVFTGVLMAWATQQMQVHYFLAQLCTTGLLLVFTFVGNRLWTFRHAG